MSIKTEPDLCPFGPAYQDSWDMRHALFSRYDDGIQLDAVGLLGAKPEQAAYASAKLLPGGTVLDGFCGSGGSAIAFARAGKQVISLDLEPSRLAMAQHNARVYGLEDRIRFIQGDVFKLLHRLEFDCVYLDPPWGAIDAWERPRFGLTDFTPPVDKLVASMLSRAPHVLISVPPNFDFAEFAPYHCTRVQPALWEGEVLYFDVSLERRGAATTNGSAGPGR